MLHFNCDYMEGAHPAIIEKLVKDIGWENDFNNYLLTDDKAPVEVLGMRVIDGLIREELGYYKEIYEEEGIRGLIESF